MTKPKRRILIVDDEASFTRLVKLNLESTARFEVQTENKGALAVETAREFKPQFIFLDMIMPDMEGSTVACFLKSNPAFRDVPIVFLTATVSTEEVGPNGGLIRGQPYLAKPVKVCQLVSCIEQFLGT